jgi:hypothetical protein
MFLRNIICNSSCLSGHGITSTPKNQQDQNITKQNHLKDWIAACYKPVCIYFSYLITLFFNVSKDCVRFECRALFGPVDALFPCTLGVRNSFFIVDLTRLGPGLVTSAGAGGL